MSTYNHSRIKSNAKIFYKNNSGHCIILTLIVVGISAVAGGASSIIPFAAIAAAYFFLPVLTMGFLGWFRRHIYEPVEPTSPLFGVFQENYWGKLGTILLVGLKTMLWTLLFIIPGYIKQYEYSMVQYLKEEYPNMPCDRCFQVSKILTDGHKWDLFYLDLSFIGWHLLAALTGGILSVVYVGPYYNSAKAFAYEELKAEAVANGKLSATELGMGYDSNAQYGSNAQYNDNTQYNSNAQYGNNTQYNSTSYDNTQGSTGMEGNTFYRPKE